ncbi:MAG TPA: hypothetical protein IAD07_11190 [Candidatus Fimivicinus intestinavium]|nr:hypothetical protein [Candidatus Fimivicinus intestinavium]
MPRPRKAIDYDEELTKLEAQITRCDKTKAELLARRQELLGAKREAEMGALYDAMQRAGVSAEELMHLINQAPCQTAG